MNAMLPGNGNERRQISPRLPVVEKPVVAKVVPIDWFLTDSPDHFAEDYQSITCLFGWGNQYAIQTTFRILLF